MTMTIATRGLVDSTMANTRAAHLDREGEAPAYFLGT